MLCDIFEDKLNLDKTRSQSLARCHGKFTTFEVTAHLKVIYFSYTAAKII